MCPAVLVSSIKLFMNVQITRFHFHTCIMYFISFLLFSHFQHAMSFHLPASFPSTLIIHVHHHQHIHHLELLQVDHNTTLLIRLSLTCVLDSLVSHMTWENDDIINIHLEVFFFFFFWKEEEEKAREEKARERERERKKREKEERKYWFNQKSKRYLKNKEKF